MSKLSARKRREAAERDVEILERTGDDPDLLALATYIARYVVPSIWLDLS